MIAGNNGNGGGPSERIAARQACTLLYDSMPALDATLLKGTLQQIIGPCTVEWARASAIGVPLVGGLAQFGPHRIVMIALDAPVREDVLSRTVGVSPMPDDLRRELLGHNASIRLLYTGDSEEPVEQLTALYVVAAALLLRGGLGLLNERAALALPTELVLTYLPQLGSSESLPIPLWVGAVTFSPDEEMMGRYLMRTYGMEQLALPELATYIRDRVAADDAYHALMNICLYMIEGRDKHQMSAGDRVDFNGRTYLFTEPPDAGGAELSAPSGLYVLVEV
jgi:hypothetical protein